MLAATSLWWALVVVARSQGMPLPWTLPPALAHGLVMGSGFIPMFFAGFLFTAGPKWLGLPPVDARVLIGPVAAMLAGWGVFGLGVHATDAVLGTVLGAAGVGAVASGWGALVGRFVVLTRASRVADRMHAKIIAGAGVVGVFALSAASFGIASGAFDIARAAVLLALWLFIGVVYVTVAHRMLPFFTSSALPLLDAWRPAWLLASFIGLLVVEAAAAVADLLAGPLPRSVSMAFALVELAGATGVLALAVRWGLVQSLRIRLLAMLHVGFVWFGLALLLAGISHALVAVLGPAMSLGLAPLHAYTMGFLGSTLIAMVTRVSCGHSGRTLAADRFVWGLFCVLQLAVLARVLSALTRETGVMLLVAALVWAACCVTWALRYGGWYGRPRADGRPG